MKTPAHIAALLCWLICALATAAHADDPTPEPNPAPAWRTAEPGWAYQFPRDHGPHRDFKTEWWYFTGNLRASDGREFGYELTWFRQGIAPTLPSGPISRFLTSDFKFAHFAISDIAAGQFDYSQKISRGAYGDAAFGDANPGPLAWIDDWTLTILPGGVWQIHATHEGRALTLQLTSEKKEVIEGETGVSRKAEGPGHASCYYSYTRMHSEGSLTLPGASPLPVTGDTWFDHEWATNQLAPGQAGWDWFSLQLADGSDLMLYMMRLTDGREDTSSSGTITGKSGHVTYLKADDFKLTPLENWHSKATGANYPTHWRVQIPSRKLDLDISTPLQNQELALPSLSYWEGLIHVTGASATVPITGHGYLELTGYGASLKGMGN